MQKGVILASAVAGALALAPSASASDCTDPGSQVFADYSDPRTYTLAPGGDFEAGAPAWELGDGAAVQLVAGDGTLVLAPGASAVSPPICVTGGYPSARMFGAAADGSSSVAVEVMYGSSEHPVGNVVSDTAWDPTRTFALAQGGFELDSATGTGTIRLGFTAVGDEPYLVDDLYIDPRRRS